MSDDSNPGRKALVCLLLGAFVMFLLGLMASRAVYGEPAHYEAPWWKFVLAIGFGIGFVANGLSRFGQWYHDRRVMEERKRRERDREF